jgi:hypothetical protein
MHEKNFPNTYTCLKIAECLGLNPIEIITEIELKKEKNPKKREYFQRLKDDMKRTAP